jgi:chemotaxis protein CheD
MTMEAKVFGGGAVIAGMNSLNVGERNTQCARLSEDRTHRSGQQDESTSPRKVCFLPASGKVMVKRPARPPATLAVTRGRP